jgi:hypothetical protein
MTKDSLSVFGTSLIRRAHDLFGSDASLGSESAQADRTLTAQPAAAGVIAAKSGVRNTFAQGCELSRESY